MSEKLSNVIGAPFQQYVLDQLYIRAAKNSTDPRNSEDVLFLANKSAWVRLISSVNITVSDNQNPKSLEDFYEKLELPKSIYTKPEDLAKNWILEAGTSKDRGQGVQLRSGLGLDGAYGLGGTNELGYRPLPGLTNVQIETVGTLGSLRQATINFKVWNMNQLNIVEALYFRLGYSMLLEWGHTQYYVNSTTNSTLNGLFTIASNTYGLDNPFAEGTNKTLVQQRISSKARELSGNYDGMLGIVSNFNWSFNQEGGYDCYVKLIGLGSIIDSLRINQSYKMPTGLVQSFEDAKQILEDREKERLERLKQDEEKKKKEAEEEKRKKELAGLPPIPTSFQSLYSVAVNNGGFVGNESNFKEFSEFYPASNLDFNIPSTVPDYYYTATSADADILNQKILGLFLRNGGTRWIPLHANFGRSQEGSSFSINTPLLEAIAINWTNSFRLESQKQTVNKIGYNSVLTRGLDARIGERLDLFYSGTSGINVEYSAKIIDNSTTKDFNVKVFYKFNDVGYRPRKEEVLLAFDYWLTGTRSDSRNTQLYLTDFKVENNLKRNDIYQDLIVYGETPKYVIKNVPYTGPSNYTKTNKPVDDVFVWFEIEFDNTSLIDQVQEVEDIDEVLPRPPEPPDEGDNEAAENESTDQQTEASETYESALHVMLSYVKTFCLAKSINGEKIQTIDILEATKTFYQDGIFKDVFNTLKPPTTDNEKYYNLTRYAKKGFNSRLMADYKLYDSIKDVDFINLSKAYLIQYQLSNVSDSDNSYPVYIKLGYLLAFINNLCLIYDSKQLIGSNNSPKGQDKNPYVFIDFHTEYNLCLTNPQQLSIDPMTCLIPFEGSDEQYKSIFPKDVVSSINGIFVPSVDNVVRGRIDTFQTQNPYQGQTMNILLNVDYLLRVLSKFSSGDKENSVNLRGYIDEILTDVNKALGNLNLFRLAYLDESNTCQIKDDQYVPEFSGESTLMKKPVPIQKATKLPLGELPIFGAKSIARQFQFKTNFSTKLGSMIAISAQAATGSVNSTDPSSLSWLNRNYQDRFKPYITDASAAPTGGSTKSNSTETKPTDEENNDIKVSTLFNTHVKSIYSDLTLDVNKIDSARNYFINQMSDLKSNSLQTSAAPPLPADLEITMDGIAGIYMGNAFLIPENRLPLTLRGTIGNPNVGFVVAGLTHTISENQWLTKVRGQMIRLRDVKSIEAQTQVEKIKQAKVAYKNTAVGGDGIRKSQSDIDFANKYTNGILPVILQEDGTYKIARIESDKVWFQPNPDYEKQLVTVQVPTRLGSTDIKVYPTFAEKLNKAFDQITNLNLEKYILNTAGGLAVRTVEGTDKLSFHAWGFAIDLNSTLYPQGKSWYDYPRNEFNLGYEEVAAILNKYGISWYKTKDPMHFSIYESNQLQF